MQITVGHRPFPVLFPDQFHLSEKMRKITKLLEHPDGHSWGIMLNFN